MSYKGESRRATRATEEGRTPEPVKPLLVHAKKEGLRYFQHQTLCGVSCDETLREPFDKEAEGSCHRCSLILDREDQS